MALENKNKMWSVGRNRVAINGSFRPDGATGIVANTTKGRGYSVARTSAGLYTIAFDRVPSDLDSVVADVRSADGIPTHAVLGDYALNTTAGHANYGKMELQLRVFRGSGMGFIHLPLGAFQEQDGTALADFADGDSTTPGWSAGDESGGIRWNNHANPDPVSTQFVWPPDLNVLADATVTVVAAKVGATIGDAVKWTIEVFNNVAAAAYDADANYGGDSSAMTGDATTKTVQLETLALAKANLPTAPCVSTFTIQPKDGTLGTDDVILLGVYITYQSGQLIDLADDVDNVINFSATFRDSSIDA